MNGDAALLPDDALPRVLMGIAASTHRTVRTVMMANIEALRFFAVSWVVALYDGDDGSGMSDVAAVAKRFKVPLTVYDGRPAGVECPFCRSQGNLLAILLSARRRQGP